MEYTVIRSSRRTLALQIKQDGTIIIRAPYRCSDLHIQRFVSERQGWIEKHLNRLKSARESYGDKPKYTADELADIARQAEEKILPRLDFYALEMGVRFSSVHFRCQKTRWGSCSGKKALNFNILLSQMPDEVLDYVVVHELCHLKEMNHSAAFWTEVQNVLPDYRKARQWLKEHGNEYLERVER